MAIDPKAMDRALASMQAGLPENPPDETLLRASIREGFSKTPKSYAEINALSRRTGLPTDTVERQQDMIRRELRARDVDYAGLVKDSPVLASFLSKPGNAAVAQNDVDVLRAMEAWAQMRKPETGLATDAADVGRSYAAGLTTLPESAGKGLSELNLQLGRKITEAIESVGLESVGEFLRQETPDVLKGLNPSWSLEQIGQGWRLIGEAIRPERQGLHTMTGEALGQLTSQVMLHYATGGATAVTTAAFGLMGFEQIAEDARSKGATEDQILTASTAAAFITAASEKFGIDKLLERFGPNVQRKFVRLLADVAIGGGIEYLQEYIEGVGHNLAAALVYDPERDIFTTPGDEELSAGLAAGIFRTVLHGVTRGRTLQTREERERSKSTLEQQQLDKLHELRAKSETAANDPEAFRDALNQMVETYGGDENVYIPAEDLKAALEGVDLETESLKQAAAQLETALETGGDVVIKVQDYLTDFVPLSDAFREIVRLSPDTLSLKEAKEADPEDPMRVLRQLEEVDTELKAQADEVMSVVSDQIVATGRMNARAARINAQLVSSYVATKAARTKRSVQDVFKSMGLEIGSDRAAGDVLEQEATDTPAFRRYESGDIYTRYEKEKGVYHRYTSGTSPDNELGYMMFSEDPNAVKHYGNVHHIFDGQAVDVETIRKELVSVLEDNPDWWNATTDTIEDAAKELNPYNIVNSAEWWDDLQFVSEVWTRVLEPKGISAVRTNDGVLVFDESLVKQVVDGTFDPNILKQGADAPRLSALHNLTSDNLVFADEMGGFAVPSIGVVREDMGIEGYGEITLIGTKDLGDPSKQDIFDADAYTSTFPVPDYKKASQTKAQALVNELRPWEEKYAGRTFTGVVQTTWDNAVNYPDPQKIIDDWLRSNGAKAMFLDEVTGKDTRVVMREVAQRFGISGEPALQEFFEGQGASKNFEYHGEYHRALSDAARKAAETFANKQDDPDLRDMLRDSLIERNFTEDGYFAFGTAGKLIDDYQNIGKKEVDTYATQDRLDKKLKGKEAQYKDWVTDKVMSIFGEPRIKVRGKLQPYTLENIVEYMTSGGVQAKEKTLTFGEGKARAVVSKRFDSLDWMRNEAKENLAPDSELKEARERAKALMEEYRNEVIEYYKWESTWDALDDSMKAIAQWAQTRLKRGSKAALRSALSKYDFRGVPDSVIEKGIEAGEAMLYAPVPYFESKPMRAVALSEFAGAAVPDDVSKATTDILDKNGIKWVKYGERHDEAARTKAVIAFREQLASEGAETLFQDKTRATFEVTDDAAIIRLMEAADLSSFAHEAGHLFLQMELLTGSEDTQQILDWLGAKSIDDVLVKPGESISEQKRAYHEKFARGWEAYLFEGKAPSVELRGVFARFTSWMKQVYRGLTSATFQAQHGAVLNDEIRQVFDRMLATDEQIAAAEAANEYGAEFFKDAQSAGMTEAGWADHQERRSRATDRANQMLAEKLLKELRRTTEKWWNKELRAEIDKAKEDLRQEPVYVARETYKGKMDEAGTNKISSVSVIEELGEVPPELKFLVNKDAVLSLDDAAQAVGFKSGLQMVEAMRQSPSLNEAAEARAQEAMLQRHGDILNDGTLEAQAQEAAHNEERGRLIFAELRAIGRKTGNPAIDGKALKAHAAEVIGKTRLRDLRPERYHRAEVRAAKLAQKAMDAGDLAEAHKRKMQQAANFYLWREATRARNRRDSLRRKLQARKTRKYNAKQVHPEFIRRLKMYLAAYDFRVGKKVDRETLLRVAQWMRDQTNETREIQILDPNLNAVLQEESTGEPAQVKSYNDMTLDELEAVEAMSAHMRYVGGQVADESKAKKQRRHAEVAASILEAAKGRKRPKKGTFNERFWKGVKSFGSNIFLHADSVLLYLDGFKDNGLAYREIKRKIDDAVTQILLPMQEASGEAIAKLYSAHYTNAQLREMNRKQTIAGKEMSKWEMIGVALNWGNESSREALLAGVEEGQPAFTEAQVGEILNQLDANDWQFVQGVWDYIGSFKSQLFDLERKRHGVVPPTVQPAPFETQHGTISGGYFPLKYDPETSFRVTEDEVNDMVKSITLGRYAKAQTRDGMLKARVGSGGRPVLLDMSVFHRHVNDVITMIALSEPVTEVQELLASKELREAMEATGNLEMLKALDVWLKDTAVGEIVSADMASRLMRAARVGFSASKIGLNIGTILVQLFGIFGSMPVVGYGNIMKGITALAVNPMGKNSAIAQVMQRSAFMRQRGLTFNKDIRDTLDHLHGSPNKPGFVPENLRKFLFSGIVFTQRYVDVATWLGAYEQGKKTLKDATEEDLIHHADRAVARTQASGVWSDRTPIERGTMSSNVRQAEAVRIWTSLASYFFAKGNVAFQKTAKTNFKNPVEAMRYAIDMMVLFSLEAIVVALMRGQIPGEDDDESLPAFVAKETAQSIMGSFPVAREMASEFGGFRGGSALSAFYETVGKAGKQTYQWTASGFDEEHFDIAMIKAWNSLGGMMFRYPSGQMNRVITAASDDESEWIDYLIWREKKE